MRILLWHGWLLEGSGSNVYTAKSAEMLRRSGHDVLLLCQQPDPDRFAFVDAWGRVGMDGPHELVHVRSGEPAAGRLTLLRPDIGELLPVFVVDRYEGFDVKRFVDLTDDELARYLDRNVAALRAATAWHGSDLIVTGHAVPGAALARRAVGAGRYVAKIHGSDLEYAVRPQRRYLELAREGLEGATAVAGGSRDVLARTVDLIPSLAGRVHVVPPGVDLEVFRPSNRRDVLERAARRLEGDPDSARGRPSRLDAEVEAAVARRDGATLAALAETYDQGVPDPDAATRLRSLARFDGPLVGYIGKFIPQKGVHLLLQALAVTRVPVRALVIGFGGYREWLTALTLALDRADVEALEWLRDDFVEVETAREEAARGRGLLDRVTFTGRLDHRYASVVAALDVLVVPSVMHEAFGMVAAEGAGAGAIPLVARHSGLAEVSTSLEEVAGRPGFFSYEPGPGASRRIAGGIDRILELPPPERASIRASISGFVAREWTWERTAERLLLVGRPAGDDVP
jgi:glycosyltransferase involved in cell wall biosynthesis